MKGFILRLGLIAMAIPVSARAQALTAGGSGDGSAAPAPTPATDAATVDLAALGLDPSSSTGFDDKLNIYGFADAQYQALHFAHTAAVSDERAFASGDLNVYLAKNLTPKWRFLAEIQFMYLPNGAEAQTGAITTTAAGDPTDFARPVSWGAILIERAYIEYDVNQYVTVRAGRFLTPYGIWNIDHGSPAIIAAYRPYIIGEEFFPAAQTGVDVFGNVHLGEYRIGYHATVSNGRSPVDAIEDPDKRVGFGARVEFEAPWAGTFKAGASVYGGRFTDVASTTGETPDAYEERSYGGDAQWDHGGLHLQGELIANSRRYLVGARALTTSGFAPDGTQYGYYGLAGYRTRVLWNVMPYVYYEHEQPLDRSEYGYLDTTNAGLNFRPASNVVLKLESAFSYLRGGGVLGSTNTNVDTFTALVAWVF